MEKLVICFMLFVMVIFSACKKESTSSPGEEYIQGWTRVLGVKESNNDTSSTRYMHARVQALAIDEDSQLKVELMGWQTLPGGNASYELKITNKTPCQMILRWGWSDLAPVISIEPNDSTANTPQSSVLRPNQVKTYFFKAKAQPGRIFVKSEQSNSTCHPSSQLKIDITTTILPIEFTGSSTSRIGDQMMVQWSTDAPGEVDKFLIMWTPTGKREDEILKATIPSDPTKKKYNATFPAIRKVK